MLAELLEATEEIEIVTSTFARALDLISSRLNEIDPSLAFAVDGHAELAWKRLGKKN